MSTTRQNWAVLVIDDDEGFRELIHTALCMTTQWNVVTASSAADARALMGPVYTEPRFDVLLVDERMPGEHGSALVRSLAEQGALDPATAILVTAADSTPEADGIAGRIEKPFDPLTLGTRIAAMVMEKQHALRSTALR